MLWQVELLPALPVVCVRVPVPAPAPLLPMQVLANVSWETVEDGSRAWVPATLVGGLDEVLVST